jgi:hypothetical protein
MCVTLAAPADAGHLPAVISAATFDRGVFAHLRLVIGCGAKNWSGSRFQRMRVAHRVPALHWMAQDIESSCLRSRGSVTLTGHTTSNTGPQTPDRKRRTSSKTALLPGQTVLTAAEPLSCSWVIIEAGEHHHRLELENNLIAACALATGTPPSAQFHRL